MPSNIKIIFIAILFSLIGLGIGYLFFGKNKGAAPMEQHQHSTELVPVSAAQETTYTCSMHPQIRQNEPGICPICEMDLIPLEANTSNDPLVLQMTEASAQLANIQTTVVGSEGMGLGNEAGKTLQLSGKIQADERLASSEVAHIPGRIEKLYVTFTGEQVRKGQKLADIYAPDLITAQRELIEAIKLKEVSPGLLEAARNKLRFWKIDPTIIETVEQKGIIEEIFPLYAQATGIVVNKRVAIGDYLMKGEPLFDLMDLRKVWVLFDAYEADLANIKVGDKIAFTVASIPNKTFNTNITYINPMINPATRVASVRAEIANSSGILKPEMFVEGILQHKETSNTKFSQLTVPKSAVLWTGKRSVVYVKVPEMSIPSFKFKEVEIGESIGDNYQITSGLEAGEEVVTNGNFSIDAAAQLNNQSSMMNRNVKVKKEQSEAIPDFQAITPKLFKEQLNALANAYIQLKDAFVKTDAATAAKAAEKVVEKVAAVDMTLLKGAAHIYWMEQLSALQAHSSKIVELQEVEAQRKQFGFLSDALINTIEAFGTAGDSLYVQHCPMAFNNEGGNWLATEEVIQNPYFGDKMMRCGLVKKTFN